LDYKALSALPPELVVQTGEVMIDVGERVRLYGELLQKYGHITEHKRLIQTNGVGRVYNSLSILNASYQRTNGSIRTVANIDDLTGRARKEGGDGRNVSGMITRARPEFGGVRDRTGKRTRKPLAK